MTDSAGASKHTLRQVRHRRGGPLTWEVGSTGEVRAFHDGGLEHGGLANGLADLRLCPHLGWDGKILIRRQWPVEQHVVAVDEVVVL
jgi:hypothetical protein